MLAKTFRRRAVTPPLGRTAMAAFVTLALLAACAAPVPSATTPLPTIAATAEVRSVCLTVEQSYRDVDGRLADQPIAATAADILRHLGLEVVLGREAGCDADVHISIVLRPLSAKYGQVPGAGGRTCYSGAEVGGEATLVVGGRGPLTQPFEYRMEPPSVVTKCRSAAEAPFDRLWSQPLVSLLGEWWGLPALVTAMEIGDPQVAGAAAAMIAGMGPDAAAVAPFLMDQLRSADPATFASAARAIVRISPEAAVEAMPLLVTALREGDRDTRLGLIRSLGGTATPVPVEAVDALVTALAGDEDAYLRAEAVRMLASMGTAAAAALPALILAIDDRGEVMGGEAATVGEAAVAALARVGETAAVIPALVEALGRDGGLRTAAIDALATLGGGAVAAAPALIDLLGGADRGSAWSAEHALGAITGQDLGDDPEAWNRWLRTLECARGTASTKASAASPDGEITVVVEHAGFVPAAFADTRPCGIFAAPGCETHPPPVVTALGQFFVVRYVVTNGTAGAIDLPAQCTTASPRRKCSGRTWWLTDGQGSWPTAWYSVWAPWVAAQGGDPDPSMDAGQTAIDWAVFDVPEGFEPAAISWPLDDGGQACLTWP